MFANILEMFGDYERRKVGRFDAEWGFVSTALVTDADKPYETAVKHRDYNDDKIVIVEAYDTKEHAETGHAQWVSAMTTIPLPDFLVDKGLSEVSQLCDVFSEDGDDWRVRPRVAK